MKQQFERCEVFHTTPRRFKWAVDGPSAMFEGRVCLRVEGDECSNVEIYRPFGEAAEEHQRHKLLSKKFQAWLREKGITHETSPAYFPDSNGRAKRVQCGVAAH